MSIISTTQIFTEFGIFDVNYHENSTGACITLGIGNIDSGTPLVRIHSSCLFSESFHSIDCDCNLQLTSAMQKIAEEESGIIAYLYQEGRGQGLMLKMKAMTIEKEIGCDTVEAFNKLELQLDSRDYSAAIDALVELNISRRIRLMSNNPRKAEYLMNKGFEVVALVPLIFPKNELVRKYLDVKRVKLGHCIDEL